MCERTILKLCELRDRAERALETMLGVPLYIAFGFEVPAKLRPGHYFAFTRLGLGAVVRPHLHRDRGPGPAIIIDERYLGQYTRAVARGRFVRRRVLAGQIFLGVAVHELGHILQVGLDRELEPLCGGLVEVVEITTVALLAQPSVPSPEKPVPFTNHGATFLRGALHLHRRLQTALRVRFELGVENDTYGLSPVWRYQSALGDESERLEHLPLTAIDATSPPAAFAELWRDDLRRWFLGLESPTNFQASAFVDGCKLFNPF